VVAGIELDPDAPGYKRILFQPQPSGQLTHVSANLNSMVGRIESKWMLEDENFQLVVTIPANTEGLVRLPVQSIEGITEHGQASDQVEGIREIRQEGEAVTLTLGSGHYHLSTIIRKPTA